MSQVQQQFSHDDSEPASDGSGGQQQQPASEGHAGRGSDSAMQHMREWEEQRTAHSGGKHRSGPN